MRGRLVRVTVVVLALQALALLGIGVFLAVRSTGSDVTQRAGAILAAVLALAAAGAFAVLARALLPPAAGWAVTPTVVVELLCLPVGVGLVQSGRPELGVPVVLVALLAVAGVVAGGARR